jgi:hypothetical protein
MLRGPANAARNSGAFANAMADKPEVLLFEAVPASGDSPGATATPDTRHRDGKSPVPTDISSHTTGILFARELMISSSPAHRNHY